ncbi:pao retrotransposon peptidase family [Labeo rohita]|nr:pao retrotransposon peptidase family [Labeo rohita]
MSTLLTEVEATLNSRPLTFVHNKVDEPQPLSPAHFLVGEQLTSLPPKPFPADYDHPTVSKEEMTRRWRYRNRLMTNLWNRWRRDYLLDLKSAHSCSPQKHTELKTGDVVLIGDANMPRQTWKLGKIEELFPGRDGKVRSCAVHTST